MTVIEANITERGLLPLPAAAMVVDIRGMSDDGVVERLSIEIADLASEMKDHQVYHWRYLADFLSFRRIGTEDAQIRQKTANGQQPDPADVPTIYGPLGVVHPVQNSWNFSFPSNAQQPTDADDSLFDHIQQNIEDMIAEIGRIRTNRVAAVRNLNKAGIPGNNVDDATVRVIFLADAENLESLSTVALYADRLKEYYRKLEHSQYQQLINITVLCMGRSGMVGPPEKLMKGLMKNNSWSHIDSLLISEDYRDDAALIAGTVQAYLAELLLYVLLIIPPLPAPALPHQPALEADTSQANGHETSKQVSLHPNTFVLGLAALEYSSRWARRWLNFGLARVVVDKLRQKPADEGKEKNRIKGLTDSWFNSWRSRVQSTVPDEPPGNIPTLEGIRFAREAAEANLHFPPADNFDFNVGKRTVEALQGYLAGLTETYIAPTRESDLRIAVLQSPSQIMQALHELKDKSIEDRQVTRLGALQVEAEQILFHSHFFNAVVGSIPRARAQLEALAASISKFQGEHQKNPMNPLSSRDEILHRRNKLEQDGNAMIDGLKDHRERWPLFTRTLPFKTTMAVLSLLLVLFLSLVTVLTGFAWLHHLIFLRLTNALPIVDASLLGIPTLEVVAWGMVLLVLLIELLLLGPALVNDRRKPLQVEIVCWVMLLAFALYGLLVNLTFASLGNLLDDTTSILYISWLSFVPQWSLFAFMAAIFILIAEIAYAVWWVSHLRSEQDRIVRELREQHEGNIADVSNFIADEVTSEILRRAELTDGKGGLGTYYSRVGQLCDLLDAVSSKAQRQQQQAANRLLLSQNESLNGTSASSNGSVWLSLHIRDEQLEIDVLTEEYKGLVEKLVEGNQDLKDLAEFLLRMAGSEKLVEIGKQIKERSPWANEDQRLLQLYITALVGISMRFTIEPLTSNINALIKQYESSDEYARQQMPALNTLIQTLKGTSKQVTLQVSGQATSQQKTATKTMLPQGNIVAEAFALWAQLLWQNNNQQLDQALTQDGVLAQLERLNQDDYDSYAVMRHLLARTSIFGKSPQKNRQVDVYLLLAPTQKSLEFRQGLRRNHRLPRIIEFPDVERVLLLGVQRYLSEPMLLPELEAQEETALLPGSSVEADQNSAVSAAQVAASASGMQTADATGTQAPTNGTAGAGAVPAQPVGVAQPAASVVPDPNAVPAQPVGVEQPAASGTSGQAPASVVPDPNAVPASATQPDPHKQVGSGTNP